MKGDVKMIYGHQAIGNCGPTVGVRRFALLGANTSSRFDQHILRYTAVLLLMVVEVSEMI